MGFHGLNLVKAEYFLLNQNGGHGCLQHFQGVVYWYFWYNWYPVRSVVSTESGDTVKNKVDVTKNRKYDKLMVNLSSNNTFIGISILCYIHDTYS